MFESFCGVNGRAANVGARQLTAFVSLFPPAFQLLFMLSLAFHPCRLIPSCKFLPSMRSCKIHFPPHRYDEEDEALLMQADADVLHDRKRMQEEWDTYLQVRGKGKDKETKNCR